jgi:uncharacterized protein YuzE
MTDSLLLGGSQESGTTRFSQNACNRLYISTDACYLRFSDNAVARTEYIGTSTRDEMVILDYDASGRIVGIELVSDEKPCQQR